MGEYNYLFPEELLYENIAKEIERNGYDEVELELPEQNTSEEELNEYLLTLEDFFKCLK